jgi:hypothetical protein
MSTTDTNRAVAQRFYDEVVSQGTFEVLDEIITEDAHDGATPTGDGLLSGRADFLARKRSVRTRSLKVVDVVDAYSGRAEE